MFFNFLDIFKLDICQYLFLGLGVFGVFLCLRYILIGGRKL